MQKEYRENVKNLWLWCNFLPKQLKTILIVYLSYKFNYENNYFMGLILVPKKVKYTEY